MELRLQKLSIHQVLKRNYYFHPPLLNTATGAFGGLFLISTLSES